MFLRGERINQYWLNHINETFSHSEEQQPLGPVATWLDLRRTVLNEKVKSPPNHILYDSIHRTFLKWQQVEVENKPQLRDRNGVILDYKRWKGRSLV